MNKGNIPFRYDDIRISTKAEIMKYADILERIASVEIAAKEDSNIIKSLKEQERVIAYVKSGADLILCEARKDGNISFGFRDSTGKFRDSEFSYLKNIDRSVWDALEVRIRSRGRAVTEHERGNKVFSHTIIDAWDKYRSENTLERYYRLSDLNLVDLQKSSHGPTVRIETIQQLRDVLKNTNGIRTETEADRIVNDFYAATPETVTRQMCQDAVSVRPSVIKDVPFKYLDKPLMQMAYRKDPSTLPLIQKKAVEFVRLQRELHEKKLKEIEQEKQKERVEFKDFNKDIAVRNKHTKDKPEGRENDGRDEKSGIGDDD